MTGERAGRTPQTGTTRWLRVGAIVMAASGGLLLSSPPASATYPGATNGRLAFGMSVGGNVDIYSVHPNGTGLQRLTTDAAFDACAAYSADGSRIAYCSNRDGGFEIWQMDQNGKRQTQVTRIGFALWPDYAPDGSRLAFEGSAPGEQNIEVYTVGTDGSSLQRLTEPGTGDNTYPAFSPDGTRIAFERNRTGTPQVWVMNSDGTDQTQLTFDAAPKDQVPDWSPDGTRIAYTADSADGNSSSIVVMDADGGNQHTIATGGSADFGARWSPDGTKLALLDGVTRDVEIVNADGSGRHVVHHDGTQFVPSWQPRGVDDGQ